MSDPSSRARIATRTLTSRPCVRISKTSTPASLKSPYVLVTSLSVFFLLFHFDVEKGKKKILKTKKRVKLRCFITQ